MAIPDIVHNTINNRYQLRAMIGRGGMGAVYRAYDRLNNKLIALKQVTARGSQLTFTSQTIRGDSVDFRLALAQEFKMLSSIRHPHIISVLDYGFDKDQHPYFTMELLDDAQPLIEATQGASLKQKCELIVQVLHALHYLHRRGVVHRDLKPGNVLVRDHTVKVLDFGLAVAHEIADSDEQVAGTLAYIAPETLQYGIISPQSDLYAVGVMAYEMLSGQHPFDLTDTTAFIQDLLLNEPDITRMDVSAELAGVVGRLLKRDPQVRFANASDVIDAFMQSAGLPLVIETPTLRDSVIQAAQFVGREGELDQLTQALQDAKNGHGGSWLIAGESGVGKSRLLDELRTIALVEGALVMRGQSVSSGGLPYRQWRDPVRRLSLVTSVTDLEAGVLSEVIPDLNEIIERDIPALPRLQGSGQQTRLVSTITALFQRQKQPMVLLLEDLQWSSESLKPLQALNTIVETLPLLIVGTYRDDERPDLPEELPGMARIKLERLQPEQIAALGESIIGNTGRRPDVVDLLWRETEGNTYFIVEVIRALAEDAGQLSLIGNRTLPIRVMAGGIQAVLRRRIQRVPEWAMPLLNLAAVYGRSQQVEVLERLQDGIDMDTWLTVCNEAAVLEVHEGRWQFAHDKLREVVLNDIDEDTLPALHRRVAEAMEIVFGDDPTRILALTEHWYAAQEPKKAADYAYNAGEQALIVGDFVQAERILEQGLSLLQDDRHPLEKARLLKHMGALHWRLSDYTLSTQHYKESLSLARKAVDASAVADALNGLGFVNALMGYFDAATEYATEALATAKEAGDATNHARALNNLGICAEDQEDFKGAHDYYQQALSIFESLDERRGMASTLNNLGTASDSMGDLKAARIYYERSLGLCREIGFQHGVATLSNNLGLLYEKNQDYQAAWDAYQQSLPVARQIGDRRGVVVAMLNMIFIALELQFTQQARDYLCDATALLQTINQPMLIPHVYAGAARIALYDGEIERAANLLGAILSHDDLDGDFRLLRLGPVQQKIDSTQYAADIQQGRTLAQSDILQGILQVYCAQ